MAVTSVRLQPDIEQDLERLAERQRRSKSWIINQAVREYAERQTTEDDRWQQTLAALDDVAAGRVLAADGVHEWLHSWGSADEPKQPKAPRARRR